MVTQTEGLPEMRLFRSEVQAVPEPAGAGGGWQGFRCVLCEQVDELLSLVGEL